MLIGEFLLELSKKRGGLTNYYKNRDEVLARSGLTKKQQAILKSNDLAKIRDAIREEYCSANYIVVPFVMFVV